MSFCPVLPIGSGLRLVPLCVDHAASLFALIDSDRERLGRFLAWVEKTRSVTDVERFCREMVGKAEPRVAGVPEAAVFVIYDNNNIAGLIDLHTINASDMTAEIGCWIANAHEGKGLVTRAVLGITAYAFSWLKMEKLFIGCSAQNTRSSNVATRAGFTPATESGKSSEDLWFVLSDEQWRKLRHLDV